jgi:hypothetical protein
MERVQAFNTPSPDRAVNNVASLLIELEGARILALQSDPPNCAAAIKATMLKAKLLGLGVSAKGHTFGTVRARAHMAGQVLPNPVAFLTNSSVRPI